MFIYMYQYFLSMGKTQKKTHIITLFFFNLSTCKSPPLKPKNINYFTVLNLSLNLTYMYLYMIFLQECISEFFQCIKCLELHSDEDVLKMKTALWAVVCQNKKVAYLRKIY